MVDELGALKGTSGVLFEFLSPGLRQYWECVVGEDNSEFVRLTLPKQESKTKEEEVYVWKLFPDCNVGSRRILGVWAD